jgi:hypothetical protein
VGGGENTASFLFNQNVVEECNESVGCLDLNLAFWKVSDADNLTLRPQRLCLSME